MRPAQDQLCDGLYFDAAALGSAEGFSGPSPASTHCGRARSETWSWDRNEAWQNDRACDPQ